MAIQMRRGWWQKKRATYFGEIDLGDGRKLAAEDVLEGHYRRLRSTQANQRLAPVQIGDDLIAAISVLAPNLSPLAELAEEVAVAMPPVQPTPQFRRNLHQALELTHRQQSAHRVLGTHHAVAETDGKSIVGYWLLAAVVLLCGFAICWQIGQRRSDSKVSLAS